MEETLRPQELNEPHIDPSCPLCAIYVLPKPMLLSAFLRQSKAACAGTCRCGAKAGAHAMLHPHACTKKQSTCTAYYEVR